MNTDLVKAFTGGIVRSAIATFGGGLLASGVITQGDIEVVAGATAVLVALVWSLIQKKKTA